MAPAERAFLYYIHTYLLLSRRLALSDTAESCRPTLSSRAYFYVNRTIPPAKPTQCHILKDSIPIQDGLQVDRSAILPSASPRTKRRQLNEMGPKSPRKGSKPLKVGEEVDSTANGSLESAEHQWVVNATAGQWSQQLHGLLLSDLNLASKRDFMNGFTVLHWAAKSGNCRTLSKVMEMTEKGGIHLDVNAKSFGGYTPLHIAAIHGQEEVIAQLVKVYNAKVNLRDYSGKKPFQYLKEGSSFKVRHLLNDPGLQTNPGQNPSTKKNIKVAASILSSTSTVLGLLSDDIAFYELTKGLKKPAPINKFLNIHLIRQIFLNQISFIKCELLKFHLNFIH
uniref:Uncharacterized protein n=1 Tax=Pseudonaja textilis TaxID=8673 RepID=A0A670XXC9_PSETE